MDMRILSISLDRQILVPSVPQNRQVAYFSGHTAHILILSPGKRESIRPTPSLTITRIGGKNKVACFFRTLQILWEMRGRSRFDIVTTQDVLFAGLLGLLFARLERIPLVVQLHGNYLDNPLWINQRLLNHLTGRVGNLVLRRSDGVRCVSDRIRRQVIKDFGVRPEKTISLPICTDLSIFSPDGGRAGGAPFVLFVGRLIEEKSPLLFCEVLIPLMKRYPDLMAAVGGQGELQVVMQRQFDEGGLLSRVLFLGQLPAQELAKWYRSSICLLHTAAWEGWGMPMIEAMACGCPVVTTDTGCAREAVRDGENGIVVPVNDVAGMRHAVERLYRDPKERKKLSEKAAEEAQKWSFSARVKEQVKFYERIINQTAPPRHWGWRTGRC
jgi:glycosyltransferase involved in cell wall biosynthesis